LYESLLARAQERVDRALHVAVLINLGVPRSEIAERLGIDMPAVRSSVQDLKEVAPALEREDDRPHE
jgi:hypothetical protein